MRKNSAAIIAVILLLTLLYGGLYLAMVTPNAGFYKGTGSEIYDLTEGKKSWLVIGRWQNYRFAEDVCRIIYWPIEKIDRSIRTNSWRREALHTTRTKGA